MYLTKDSYFLFNGGEVHCKLDPEDAIGKSRIVMRDYSMNAFMALCEYKQLINKLSWEIDLFYPYLPYARQDRVIKDDEPFSLRIFCELLNSLNFKNVLICDPHSDVTPALIKNCSVIHQWEVAGYVIPRKLLEDPNVIFVSPDAGAYKKVSKLMTNDYRIAIGSKIRGTNGEIIKTTIQSECTIKDMECVIVDDICDGGRTFIELAKVLKRKGAKKIYLYVTHGIFSNGIESILSSGIDHIYTTNSFIHSPHPQVTTYEIC